MRPIIVIKVGTSSLVVPGSGVVAVSALARLAEASLRLRAKGYDVILVSSGAVGLGCSRLGLRERPTSIAGKQAAAAVGQVRLMSLYDDVFSVLGAAVGQVLLTYDAFGDRQQYLNARNTFVELLRLGVVPVVNENDTVAVQELRVGDNDTLSALVAAMVGASWLFLMTDVEALFTANPRVDPTGAPIRVVPMSAIQGLRRQMAQGSGKLEVGGFGAPEGVEGAGGNAPAPSGAAASSWGTGGMATKLKAAQLGTAAGVTVVISDTARIELVDGTLPSLGEEGAPPTVAPASPGRNSGGAKRASSPSPPDGVGGGVPHSASSDSDLAGLAEQAPVGGGEGAPPPASLLFVERSVGTTFLPAPHPVRGRKRWILGLVPQGVLVLDAGAAAAVLGSKSTFPAGVVDVHGSFDAHDAVSLVDAGGRELARGLINYTAADCRKVKGLRSRDCATLLESFGPEALVDRDNTCVIGNGVSTRG